MWNSRNVGGADWHNIAERGGGRKKSIRRQTQDPTRLIGLVKPCDVAEAEPLTSDRISAVKQELLLKTSLRMRLPVLILHKLLTIWDWKELERRYWFTILQRRWRHWRRAVSEVFRNQNWTSPEIPLSLKLRDFVWKLVLKIFKLEDFVKVVLKSERCWCWFRYLPLSPPPTTWSHWLQGGHHYHHQHTRIIYLSIIFKYLTDPIPPVLFWTLSFCLILWQVIFVLMGNCLLREFMWQVILVRMRNCVF